MGTIIKYCACVAVAATMLVGCYGAKEREMTTFYRQQQHDVNLIGIWSIKVTGAPSQRNYVEYRGDGSICNYVLFVSTEEFAVSHGSGGDYWYTKDGILYTMGLGQFAPPTERIPIEYHFSEDKTELYLEDGKNYVYIRGLLTE